MQSKMTSNGMHIFPLIHLSFLPPALAGFSDFGEGWQESLFPDNTDIEKMADTLWTELRPMYLQLHAYVRGRLREHYGDEVVGTDGTLPAHLLGESVWNMTGISAELVSVEHYRHIRFCWVSLCGTLQALLLGESVWNIRCSSDG